MTSIRITGVLISLLFLLISFSMSVSSVSAKPAGFIDTDATKSSGFIDTDATKTSNRTISDFATLDNPLQVDSIEELLQLILDILLIFAVPIIIFFIIYSGFLYVTAQGNPEKIKKATSAFTWTVVGGVIILAANLLLTVIINTVNSL